MGTAFSTVIAQATTIYLNDETLLDEFRTNPALYFRKMNLYLKSGIARFNRPPEMRDYLAYDDASFSNYQTKTVAIIPAGGSISTGIVGYELCNINIVGIDKFGDPMREPLTAFTYDAETGEIVFTDGVPADTVLDVDFYNDGAFKNELNDTQIRLLCLCMQLVWEFRFAGNWLNRQPKIRDKSFSPVSEASTTRADTERYKAWEKSLNDELEAYAQSETYRAVIAQQRRLPIT